MDASKPTRIVCADGLDYLNIHELTQAERLRHGRVTTIARRRGNPEESTRGASPVTAVVAPAVTGRTSLTGTRCGRAAG